MPSFAVLTSTRNVAEFVEATLGVGDDTPSLQAVLHQPNKADGSPGDRWDMTGGSCEIVIAPKDRSSAAATYECAILDQEVILGGVEFDWTDFDSAVALDYDFRFKGTLASGKKFSVPNDGWYSLAVTADPG